MRRKEYAGLLESRGRGLVSTRRIVAGIAEFIVDCSWDTVLVLLMLLQFISMAFTLSKFFPFARSGVNVLAGFGANVRCESSVVYV